MKHVDEGTIHAWLDGALPAAEAGEVDAHVRACRRCAEAVAEARGLVAASSRILGALDDVPANVIPATPARKQRRMWRAAPWVMGIAALLVAAVVLEIPERARTERSVAGAPRMTADSVAPMAPAFDVTVPDSSMESMSAQRTRVAQAPAGRAVPGSAARGGVGGSGVASVVITGAASAEGVTAPSPANPRVVAADDAQLARRQVAAEDTRARRRGDAGAELDARQEKARVAAAPAPPPAAASAQSTPLIDTRAARSTDPLRHAAARDTGLAGCYVVTLPARERGVVSGLSSAARERRGARASVPSAAAVPLAEDRAPDRLLVRLDTVVRNPGYLVRTARGDSSVGWWRRITPDSAQLDLLSAGIVNVGAAQRIACPEPPG